MSNHAIGYDLGNVLEGIMNLYDEKELSETAVFKINDMLHDDFEEDLKKEMDENYYPDAWTAY